MRLDELPRSDNVEDRRGQDMSPGRGFRVPGGRGGLGIGTIVVLGLIGYWLGIDPRILIGGAEILSGSGSSQQQSYPEPRDQSGPKDVRAGAPSDQMGEFVSAVLGSTETQWQKIFAQYGKAYEPPRLVMFSGVTNSGCGSRNPQWDPSTAQTIARFTSTPRSSRTWNVDSARATPAASLASSLKPM